MLLFLYRPRGGRRTYMSLAIVGAFLASIWQLLPDEEIILSLSMGLAICLLLVRDAAESLASKSAKRAVILMIFLLMVLNFGYDSCPHARYVVIGPIYVTVDGKRCGNFRHRKTLVTWLMPSLRRW